ncbi:MAG: hypothetical protein AAF645_19560 [Myxococcota bacterium]
MRVLAILALVACGGAEQPRTLVDESNDLVLEEPSSAHLAGTQPVGPSIGGTQWTWVEAACTEGQPALEGFARVTRVIADETGLLFVHDDTIGEDCQRTSVQYASPGTDADSGWQMEEQAAVDVGECAAPAEPNRPGDVRRRGEFLEVYVQRSVFCNGLELRMVYAPGQPTATDDLRLAMHYAVHFNRRDARRITELFASTGSLVDPFTRTPLDQASRYDGQPAVFGWFQETFNATHWLALKVVSLQPGDAPGSVVLDWQYMDPRLDEPFAGRNRFTVAGGEIFETSIEITAERIGGEGEGDEAPPEEENNGISDEELLGG